VLAIKFNSIQFNSISPGQDPIIRHVEYSVFVVFGLAGYLHLEDSTNQMGHYAINRCSASIYGICCTDLGDTAWKRGLAV
jgi:hypothetical protein